MLITQTPADLQLCVAIASTAACDPIIWAARPSMCTVKQQRHPAQGAQFNASLYRL